MNPFHTNPGHFNQFDFHIPDKRKSTHHHPPKSRTRHTKEVALPENFHRAFHTVFHNLYGEECVKFLELLEEMITYRKSISSADLQELRRRAKC